MVAISERRWRQCLQMTLSGAREERVPVMLSRACDGCFTHARNIVEGMVGLLSVDSGLAALSICPEKTGISFLHLQNEK